MTNTQSSHGIPLVQNLYDLSSASSDQEVVESLIDGKQFRLERIVSTGQSTPEGEWYDQDQDEWVVLLTGCAQLLFDHSETRVDLNPGDYLLIPAHQRHRVESTSKNESTTWLALHFTG